MADDNTMEFRISDSSDLHLLKYSIKADEACRNHLIIIFECRGPEGLARLHQSFQLDDTDAWQTVHIVMRPHIKHNPIRRVTADVRNPLRKGTFEVGNVSFDRLPEERSVRGILGPWSNVPGKKKSICYADIELGMGSGIAAFDGTVCLLKNGKPLIRVPNTDAIDADKFAWSGRGRRVYIAADDVSAAESVAFEFRFVPRIDESADGYLNLPVPGESCVAPNSENERPTAIPLTITAPKGTSYENFPVTHNVPFPRGLLVDARQLTLTDRDGKPVRCQVQAANLWDDDSIQWIMLDFAVSVPAGERAVYTITCGECMRKEGGWFGQAATPRRIPVPVNARIDSGRRTEHGFISHTVDCPYYFSRYAKTPHEKVMSTIEVLLPDDMKPGKRYPVLYALPPIDFRRLTDNLRDKFGPLPDIREQELHNRYQVICVKAMSPSRHIDWQYLFDVIIPHVDRTYPTIPEPSGRMIIGFSKTGADVWRLLQENPDIIGKACGWDFSFDWNLIELNTEWLRGQPARLVIMGATNPDPRGTTPTDHKKLTEKRIPHLYDFKEYQSHNWYDGWIGKAMELLFKEPLPAGLPPAPLIRVFEHDGAITVDTGPIQLTVSKKQFNLIDKILVNGKPALCGPVTMQLTSADGQKCETNGLEPYCVCVEDAGPVRATIAVRGFFSSGNAARDLTYTTRIHAYAGKSFVKIEQTITNRGTEELKIAGQMVRIPLAHSRPVEQMAGTEKTIAKDAEIISSQIESGVITAAVKKPGETLSCELKVSDFGIELDLLAFGAEKPHSMAFGEARNSTFILAFGVNGHVIAKSFLNPPVISSSDWDRSYKVKIDRRQTNC